MKIASAFVAFVAVAALPVVLIDAVPVKRLAGTAVIGIVMFAEPLNDWAVAVTPLNPIVRAVASFVAVPALPDVLIVVEPVKSVPGTAVIGIVIFEPPLKDCAVAVTPDNEILLAVFNLTAVSASKGKSVNVPSLFLIVGLYGIATSYQEIILKKIPPVARSALGEV